MPIYEYSENKLRPAEGTTFGQQGLQERGDLQRLLRDQVEILDEDVMVLAEEFGHWADSKRRIDLLGLDREAQLVVIELKRTESGGYMELQALRYAAMASNMTFDQAVQAHARWLKSRDRAGHARRRILKWLDWSEPDEELFARDVRILLVSGDFSKELMTSILWLNERELDIRCVRMKPYKLDGRILIDVQQVVPLPEAADYQIRVREKLRRERRSRDSRRDTTRFDVTIDGDVHPNQPKRRTMFLIVKTLCEKGVTPDEVTAELQRKGHRLWRTVEGDVGSEEFAALAAASAANGGFAWAVHRWYCQDHEFIHAGGKTYALSNQWGGRAIEAMKALLQRWPKLGVAVEETSFSFEDHRKAASKLFDDEFMDEIREPTAEEQHIEEENKG